MFPSEDGNACLDIGGRFVISVFGTENVFTADRDGPELRIQAYGEQPNQIWRCVRDHQNRYGFINERTGLYLGRTGDARLACMASEHLSWEYLTFNRLSTGGYELSVNVEGELGATVASQDAGGTYMRLAEANDLPTAVGLHRLTFPPFRRLQWVIPGRLARSSAPYYDSRDSDQKVDEAAISFLAGHGIEFLISLNSVPLSASDVEWLACEGIDYKHVPVQDFHAPTPAQLQQVCAVFDKANRATLVFSGYGQGRAGTAISAVQIHLGRELSESDMRGNLVKTQEQMEALGIAYEKPEG